MSLNLHLREGGGKERENLKWDAWRAIVAGPRWIVGWLVAGAG